MNNISVCSEPLQWLQTLYDNLWQQAYPRLRDQLRQHFAQCDLHTSIDSRYRLLTAHVTLVRFTQPLRQPAQFAELLQDYRHYHFGQHNINELKLVFNNWYQQQAITRQLGALRLGA